MCDFEVAVQKASQRLLLWDGIGGGRWQGDRTCSLKCSSIAGCHIPPDWALARPFACPLEQSWPQARADVEKPLCHFYL